jgi:hypothetical protein
MNRSEHLSTQADRRTNLMERLPFLVRPYQHLAGAHKQVDLESGLQLTYQSGDEEAFGS